MHLFALLRTLNEGIQFPVSLEVNRNPRAELSLPLGKKSTTWWTTLKGCKKQTGLQTRSEALCSHKEQGGDISLRWHQSEGAWGWHEGQDKRKGWCSQYNAQPHVLPALLLARFSGTEKWFVWRSPILLCLNRVFGKVLVIHRRIKPSEL